MLQSTVLSRLAADGDDRIANASFAVAMLDVSSRTPLGAVMSPSLPGRRGHELLGVAVPHGRGAAGLRHAAAVRAVDLRAQQRRGHREPRQPARWQEGELLGRWGARTRSAEWQAAAEQRAGSWWAAWADWMLERSGVEVPARMSWAGVLAPPHARAGPVHAGTRRLTDPAEADGAALIM